MSYQNNIPKSTDLLSKSQSDILNNFAALQTLIDVNHVDFASADQGKHKFVTFPVQSPAPAFAIGEVGLYNFLYPTTAVNELFLVHSDGASYPITASTTTGFPVATNGWTYLPSGMFMVWGQGHIGAGGVALISYNSVAGFPGFNTTAALPQVTRIIAGTFDNSLSVAPAAVPNKTQFRVFSSTGQNNIDFSWMTIGL